MMDYGTNTSLYESSLSAEQYAAAMRKADEAYEQLKAGTLKGIDAETAFKRYREAIRNLE
jgi:hypothetical protein